MVVWNTLFVSPLQSTTIKTSITQQRIDAFELWCWRRLMRVPWTARRSNQSILKEINPEYSLKDWCWSWNSNTLATWCEELTPSRSWCWERLRAGGEGDDRGWDGWMASPTLWTWVWASSGSWWWTGKPVCCGPWGLKESDMTELNWTQQRFLCPRHWDSRDTHMFVHLKKARLEYIEWVELGEE